MDKMKKITLVIIVIAILAITTFFSVKYLINFNEKENVSNLNTEENEIKKANKTIEFTNDVSVLQDAVTLYVLNYMGENNGEIISLASNEHVFTIDGIDYYEFKSEITPEILGISFKNLSNWAISENGTIIHKTGIKDNSYGKYQYYNAGVSSDKPITGVEIETFDYIEENVILDNEIEEVSILNIDVANIQDAVTLYRLNYMAITEGEVPNFASDKYVFTINGTDYYEFKSEITSDELNISRDISNWVISKDYKVAHKKGIKGKVDDKNKYYNVGIESDKPITGNEITLDEYEANSLSEIFNNL